MSSISFFLRPAVQFSSGTIRSNTSDPSDENSQKRELSPPRLPSILTFLAFLHIQHIPLVFPPEYEQDDTGRAMNGISMEVRFGTMNGSCIAVKRLNAQRAEWDYRRMMEDLLFELKVMTHDTIRDQGNIVKLLAVSLETEDDNPAAIKPVLIVEAADRETPDLETFFTRKPKRVTYDDDILSNFTADVADGLDVIHQHRIVHS